MDAIRIIGPATSRLTRAARRHEHERQRRDDLRDRAQQLITEIDSRMPTRRPCLLCNGNGMDAAGVPCPACYPETRSARSPVEWRNGEIIGMR